MARLRVVLETNVLVSGFAYPGSVPGRIVATWLQGGLNVVLSHYTLDEMMRVLPRLKRSQMTPVEIRDLADGLMFLAELVEPENNTQTDLRDPADQPVLVTLTSAKADYLITGDKDLLALSYRFPILTPTEFWSRHGN